VPISCPRSLATHSALPQVRPEPRRGLPHWQADRMRASQAACASNSAMPPGPGTETTGRIRPPGNASHSRGLSAAGPPGTEPMTPSSSVLETRHRLGGLSRPAGLFGCDDTRDLPDRRRPAAERDPRGSTDSESDKARQSLLSIRHSLIAITRHIAALVPPRPGEAAVPPRRPQDHK